MTAEDSIKKCIYCKKTLTSNRHIPLCKACMNKGKKISQVIVGAAAFILTPTISKKFKK
ncbi:hypothetical protein [Streptococcus oralis]|jgi:hypothetical protein|uniref:hypothetical protein n=1 Tax=Streptococcus oralis TaxID=1303 RepID=UPI000A5BCECD|nr:hypothetical protein [Streptococcus oralis]DAV92471.1 MAG TPA: RUBRERYTHRIN TRANSPORT, IRON, FERROXIDASE.1A [Caudoviricetes sp.]